MSESDAVNPDGRRSRPAAAPGTVLPYGLLGLWPSSRWRSSAAGGSLAIDLGLCALAAAWML